LRRFAPELYVSEFRIKSGMTSVCLASPGVGFGIARRRAKPFTTEARRHRESQKQILVFLLFFSVSLCLCG
jgi:hypothetical protein